MVVVGSNDYWNMVLNSTVYMKGHPEVEVSTQTMPQLTMSIHPTTTTTTLPHPLTWLPMVSSSAVRWSGLGSRQGLHPF